MKAVCISCFNYYDNRLKHVEQFLVNKGYDVEYITSDFDHIDKVRYTIERINVIQIHVKPYYKNLSAQRLLSHYFFSRRVFKQVKRIKPDLLYVVLPPNFLARFASKYRKRNKIKLIYDLYDLWPETFPSGQAKKLLALPFKFWGGLRDKNLGSADVIATECGLYQEKLKYILNGMNTDILYLTKEKSKLESKPNLENDSINICYLGSINNIIDIPMISKLLSAVNKIKPVTLHIIGDGESREQFIDAVKSFGAKVEFYGKVYEEEKKREIFDRCSFGINMMKSSVCVGLTMKSIDYFQAGLPILNSIQADTAQIVDEYKIGINVTNENIIDVAAKVVNAGADELITMRKNTRKAFEKLFSIEAFNEKLEDMLKEI